jgi:hypothetical protein
MSIKQLSVKFTTHDPPMSLLEMCGALFLHLSTYYLVCACVCTVISPKAGWILIQCWHQMNVCTHTHAHMPMHSTPHTTTARCTKPGVKWGRVASSFPPQYCTQPDNDEVHYMAKICNTNLIYLHHPQTDNNNESACILVKDYHLVLMQEDNS